MPILRRALVPAVLASLPALAQTTPSAGLGGFTGTAALAGGGAFVEGDRARFQFDRQQRKSGFIGVEELRLTRDLASDATVVIEGRAVHGNEDYRLRARWAHPERGHVEAGAESFRVFYDGSGGYFHPTDLWLEPFDDALHVDRGRIWIRAGLTRPDTPHLIFGYEHRTRSGKKGSTAWGDSNLVGAPFGTRSIAPSFWELDETREIVTLDLFREGEEHEWRVGGRYEHAELDNHRQTRRRPLEAADRFLTTTDRTTTDLFSLNGYVLRQLTEQIAFSTGALVTRLDSDLGGSRIYGASYEPIYDPLFVRRQPRDEGVLDLTGGSSLRQYVANLNLDYRPNQAWQIRPALRAERTRTENISEFLETNVTTSLVPRQEEAEGVSDRDWTEVTESLDVSYRGRPNWTFRAGGEWLQGRGDLNEELLLLETGEVDLDRRTELERFTQKYTLGANWYVRAGLTVAAQYYFKTRTNDFDTVRDSTPNTLTSSDRYPGYITHLAFATHDANVRLTWRPLPNANVTFRYDYQQSEVDSTEAGLREVRSGRYRSHIFSQNAIVTPIPRLYLTAHVNLAYDQVHTPATDVSFVTNGDNNHLQAGLGGGYALRPDSDLTWEFSHYRADNFIDVSAATLPYGADEHREAASLGWIRRQSENLTYLLRYTFATYNDRAAGGRNDYDAHIVYGRIQYRF